MSELRDPEQPTFIYDITKPWEEVVKNDPIWKSGKFPELPKEKKYTFLGFDLISPIIISAGPASGKHWTDFYFKMGFGGVIEKTRRSVPKKSNTAPNVAVVMEEESLRKEDVKVKPLKATTEAKAFEKYKSITNSFGNPSPAMQVWVPLLMEQKKAKGDGQIFGCSVTATIEADRGCVVILNDDSETALIMETAEDLLMAASAAASTGIDFLEFNLACPNVLDNSEEGEMFQSAKLVAYTLSEFKKRFPDVKAGFKFGLYKDKRQMREVFKSAGDNLDYVSGVNAVAMPVLAEDGSEILPGRATSGVCGKILKGIALEATKWAAEIRAEEKLNYQILAGGGILEPGDVDEFLDAGADAVQVATIAMVNPLFAHEYNLSKS